MSKISVVFLCGGMSSRFGGQIKQFAKIGKNDETLIEVSMNQALKCSFNEIVFIVSNKTEQPFKEKFGYSYKNIPIKYAKQEYNLEDRDRPWGTADAFSCLKNVVNNSFIICNGDDLYGENTFKICYDELVNNNRNTAMSFPLITLLPENGKVNRGVFYVDTNNEIKSINELLDISIDNVDKEIENIPASVNFMGLQKDVVDLVYEKNTEFKENHKNDRKIEHFLPIVLSDLINENKIRLYCVTSPDKCVGVTKIEDIEIVKKYYN